MTGWTTSGSYRVIISTFGSICPTCHFLKQSKMSKNSFKLPSWVAITRALFYHRRLNTLTLNTSPIKLKALWSIFTWLVSFNPYSVVVARAFRFSCVVSCNLKQTLCRWQTAYNNLLGSMRQKYLLTKRGWLTKTSYLIISLSFNAVLIPLNIWNESMLSKSNKVLCWVGFIYLKV